jgi:SAM-dependent methyltransferase
MEGNMSTTLSPQEILQRMKTHVEQIKTGSQSSASGQAPSDGEPWYAPAAPVTTPMTFSHPGSRDFLPLELEIEAALQGTLQVGQLNPRQPGLLNAAIQFFKKVMRRSLSWYTRPIHHFQGAVIRALQQILILLQGYEEPLDSVSQAVARQSGLLSQAAEESARFRAAMTAEIAGLQQKASALESATAALNTGAADLQRRVSAGHEAVHERQVRLDDRASAIERRLSNMAASHQEDLSRTLIPYAERLASITDELGWLRSESDRLRNQLRETILQGRLRDRDLRRYFHDLQAGALPSFAQPAAAPIPPMFPSGVKSDSEFDYFRFEELYRGDEALIATRQKEYLDFFRGRDNVVDIGCGRGEFLELMRDNGIKARGVELGTDQYLLCREKALEVVQEDLFKFLESLPDESLGGLFSAQVIEHLAAGDQLRFVSLAYEKTSPGSPVIFETINAQSVFAVVRNFFLDPTHVRPVHPETLKVAMESAKFHDVEIRFSSPLLERRIPPLKLNGDVPQMAEFNRAVEELNDLIYGYLDYAAIGWH